MLFRSSDLGPIHWLLGIKVTQDLPNHTISSSQHAFINSILLRFNFTDLKPSSVLMDPNTPLSKSQSPTKLADCYNFFYFVLFTYVFSLFLEVSHGAATLTHFSLAHIAATLLTHCTAVVLTHRIAILIALPHWCSIYSGQSCRLFFS